MKITRLILLLSLYSLSYTIFGQNNTMSSTHFYLEYTSPLKRVNITGNSMRVVQIIYSYANLMTSEPTGKKEETHTIKLKKEELDQIIDVVTKSDFFTLKQSVYGTSDTEKFEPFSIFIKSPTQEKNVLFKSKENSPVAPESFLNIEKIILKYATK